MSRRNGNGRRGGGRSLQQTLRRRVESCISRFSTAYEIFRHLCSTFPEYRRINKQTLLRLVQDALALHSTTTNNTASRKRRKNIDEEEGDVRLQKMELSMPSTSSDLASDDETSETSSDSTSEDAPAFDLMKRTLRNSCKGTKAVPVAEEDKNVELDEGNTSSTVNVGKCGGEDEPKTARKQVKGSVSNGRWRLKDFGWMKEDLEELRQKVITPLCHPRGLRHLGQSLRPVTGILLHGPPGCGKTSLAQAIANETRLPFDHISATEFVSGVSGASEENIRAVFTKARKRTTSSIIFVDEIDAIASKRENLQREMEKRIVTQLMTCMDQSNQPAADDDSDKPPCYVIVIGATNRPDALDRALRRPGRFDLEIYIGFPDEAAREDILSVLTSSLKLKDSLDLRKIARSTPGFVGADLVDLVNNAGYLALNRTLGERKPKLELSQDFTSEHSEDWWKEDLVPEEIDKLAIKMSDFEEAVKKVQPSSRREGFSSIPNVKWEDVGGYDRIRQEFERYIVKRIKYPKLYEAMGSEPGFLLYGPPGCGKTLIAKAVANEAGANFIHIKGPELLSKYVGESELAVRKLFSRARTCAPCIIFFDEVDAITTKHDKEGGWVIERPLKQLLIELDGAERRKGVFVIGATNRPEVMDPAVLRPGRFGKLLHVPLPSADNRVLILKALARNKPVDASVDLSAIARMEACENLSGADLNDLMEEAQLVAIEEMVAIDEKSASTETTCDTPSIKTSHVEVALSKASPSVSDMQKQHYQRLPQSLKAA